MSILLSSLSLTDRVLDITMTSRNGTEAFSLRSRLDAEPDTSAIHSLVIRRASPKEILPYAAVGALGEARLLFACMADEDVRIYAPSWKQHATVKVLRGERIFLFRYSMIWWPFHTEGLMTYELRICADRNGREVSSNSVGALMSVDPFGCRS